ncbi:MAG: V-type ATPase subunit [Clostridia bacterium]|nr:V-type ATPase subunit [Clostridia bacterium]
MSSITIKNKAKNLYRRISDLGKRKNYSENEYSFASAKLAAMSASLLTDEEMLSLADEKTAGDVIIRLREKIGRGISGKAGKTPEDENENSEEGKKKAASVSDEGEELLVEMLAAAYDRLAEFCPDTELLSLVRLRYDCHNVKTAIKCQYFGIDPKPFMIDCGTVPAQKIIKAAESEGDSAFDVLPENMSKAAKKAKAELDSAGAARSVDTLIDAACFADMGHFAGIVGFRPAEELIKAKIDLTNIISVLRIGRIRNKDNASALLADSISDGGNVPADVIRSASGDREKIADAAKKAGFENIVSDILGMSENASGLEDVARAADIAFLELTKKITYMRLLGAYPLIHYVISLEYEIKNLRIIISGKEAGNDPNTVRERLRLENV